ncbi:N/A [soil metagenome]
MCGIFGLNFTENLKYDPDLLSYYIENLFLLSESRGKEASGFAFGSDNDVKIFKTPERASRIVKDPIYKTALKSLENSKSVSAIGHSRLVTNGLESSNLNNQPVVRDGIVLVHNGIVTNVDEIQKRHNVKFNSGLDSEIIPYLLKDFKIDPEEALSSTFSQIYGMTTIACFFENFPYMLLATNNGSLYYAYSNDNKSFIFASEKYILTRLFNDKRNTLFDQKNIKQLYSGNALLINRKEVDSQILGLSSTKKLRPILSSIGSYKFEDLSIYNEEKLHVPTGTITSKDANTISCIEKSYYSAKEKIDKLKRCKKCILPETFPFIEFDTDGICNFCRNYKKIEYLGEKALEDLVSTYRKKNSNVPECLVPFSGGRDSSYALHFIVKELGMKPLAYSYDWGMVTDLARRNQARLCGKLGVEHIYISADIRKKRDNIRKNVSAWLKKPHLGMIPLFMAGDKQYFYYANVLLQQNDLKLSVLGENMLEITNFKSGFCGIKPKFPVSLAYSLTTKDKVKLASFYAGEYIMNPAYINSSIIDTLSAFRSYYLTPHTSLNVFDYLEWKESKVVDTIISEYDWETSPDTTTTWRIGDGTASFYNFIYFMVAGFTENDTFRSNQVREGILKREDALKTAERENQPRWESIKWYLDTIGLDFESSLQRITKIPARYCDNQKI